MLLQRLEALPVGSFHYKLLVITGLGWLFDAMDTGLIAFVLPVLGKEWGLVRWTDGGYRLYWSCGYGNRGSNCRLYR